MLIINEYQHGDTYFGEIKLSNNSHDIGFANYELNKRFRSHCDVELFNSSVMDVYDVEIVESFRGCGYGKNLLKSIVRYSKKKRIKFVRLSVCIDNDIAIRLYTKLKFDIHKCNLYEKTYTMVLAN